MYCLNRRRFFRDVALTSAWAVAGLTLGGLALPARAEYAALAAARKTAAGSGSTFKPDLSGRKILVAYDTMFGSTAKVAQEIGSVLKGRGAAVKVKVVDDLKDARDFEALVIGSAIRSGSWLDDAVQFVADNQADLKNKPVAYFQTCLALAQDTPQTRAKAAAQFEPTLKKAALVKPVSSAAFGGVLDYSKMSFLMRLIMRRKMEARGVEEGDYRDFAAIRDWAAALIPSLTQTPDSALAG